jgi:hypothetical protein
MRIVSPVIMSRYFDRRRRRRRAAGRSHQAARRGLRRRICALAGIAQDTELARAWIFKGGTITHRHRRQEFCSKAASSGPVWSATKQQVSCRGRTRWPEVTSGRHLDLRASTRELTRNVDGRMPRRRLHSVGVSVILATPPAALAWLNNDKELDHEQTAMCCSQPRRLASQQLSVFTRCTTPAWRRQPLAQAPIALEGPSLTLG